MPGTFDESKVKRDEDGKFAEKSGGGVGTKIAATVSGLATGAGVYAAAASALKGGAPGPVRGRNKAIAMVGAALAGALAARTTANAKDPVAQAAGGIAGGMIGATLGGMAVRRVAVKSLSPAAGRVTDAFVRHAKLADRAARSRGVATANEVAARLESKRAVANDLLDRRWRTEPGPKREQLDIALKAERAKLLRGSVAVKDLNVERAKPFALESDPYKARRSKLNAITGALNTKSLLLYQNGQRSAAIAGGAAGIAAIGAIRRKGGEGDGARDDAAMRRVGDFIADRHIERLRREGKLGNDPALRTRLAAMPGAPRADKADGGDLRKSDWEEAKHPRDESGRWTEAAGAIGGAVGSLAGGIVGQKFADAAFGAAMQRFGVQTLSAAARYGAPALQVGGQMAISGAAATGVGLVGAALGVGAVHGLRAFQDWQKSRSTGAAAETSMTATELERRTAAIRDIESRTLRGEISPLQAKQEFMDGGASTREAGYMVSRINRMARAEKAFMVGSALGEADVLLQKKDGRAGRDGDGDGKLNEGKDRETSASSRVVGAAILSSAVGAAIGAQRGKAAAARATQALTSAAKARAQTLEASAGELYARAQEMARAGADLERHGLSLSRKSQSAKAMGMYQRGYAKTKAAQAAHEAASALMGRSKKLTQKVSGRVARVSARAVSRGALRGGAAGLAVGGALGVGAYYATKHYADKRAEKAFMIGSALGEADGLIKAFDESKVRRDEDGKFAEKSGPLESGGRTKGAVIGGYLGGSVALAAAANRTLSAGARTVSDAIDGAILGVKAGADRVTGAGKFLPKPGAAIRTKPQSRGVFARAVAGAKAGVAAGKDLDRRLKVASSLGGGRAGVFARKEMLMRGARTTKMITLPVLAASLVGGAYVGGKIGAAIGRREDRR
jgi:hypothetical protein